MSELMLINPRKRRKTRKAASPKRRVSARRAKRRHNPARRHHAVAVHHRKHRRHAKRRHNPASRAGIMASLKPALVGAGGALALDFLWAKVAPKLPDTLKSSDAMKSATKIGVAIGLGVLLDKTKLVKGETARQAVAGMLTTTIHDAAKAFINNASPGALSEYMGGFDQPYGGVGEYMGDAYTGIGLNGSTIDKYLSDTGANMGEYMGDAYSDSILNGDAPGMGDFPSAYDI